MGVGASMAAVVDNAGKTMPHGKPNEAMWKCR